MTFAARDAALQRLAEEHRQLACARRPGVLRRLLARRRRSGDVGDPRVDRPAAPELGVVPQ